MKILIFLLMGTVLLVAQPSWKRSSVKVKTERELFHSTFVVNLPTTETIQEGNFEFEISHRFLPTISEGFDMLYGLDGPVNMRISLGYGISDNLLLTLARSNVNDNYDIWMKYKAAVWNLGKIPVASAFRFGGAWNTEVPGRERTDNRNFQYYGQMIWNSLIFNKKIGIGTVFSFVGNADYNSSSGENAGSAGLVFTYYVKRLVAFFMEYNGRIGGFSQGHNALSSGIQLETGGHFFKIFITNSALLNPAQNLTGSELDWTEGDLRIGFSITRAISLKK